MTDRCCEWNHVRPCGPVDNSDEPLCACGCSGYDERCGGGEWWGNTEWTLPGFPEEIFKIVGYRKGSTLASNRGALLINWKLPVR